jgi:hypothetical protein
MENEEESGLRLMSGEAPRIGVGWVERGEPRKSSSGWRGSPMGE